MKKKLVLLMLLTLIFNVNGVKAADDSCKNVELDELRSFRPEDSGVEIFFDYYDSDPNDGDDYDESGKNKQLTGWKTKKNDYNFYKFTSAEGDTFLAYCRNAGASPGVNYTFDCQKALFDPNNADSQNEISRNAFEKGIIEILKKGYKAGGGDANWEYAATVLALRTFEKYWPLYSNNGDHANHRQNKIIKYYADLWLDDSRLNQKIKFLSEKLGGSSLKLTKYYKDTPDAKIKNWNNGSSDVTEHIGNKALSLILDAFDASTDYVLKGAATISWGEKGTRTKTSKGIKYTHTLDIKNFTSADSYIKAEVECEKCDSLGVTTSLTVDGESFSGDLLSYTTNGTGKVKLEVNFTKPSNTEECEDVPYKIKLTYYDETIDTEAYVIKDSSCPNCQEFYLLYAEDVEKEAEIEGKAKLCSEESECMTYIENAECSIEESDINLKEGYSSEDNCGSIKEDVLHCVIESEDPAGNSYQAKTEEFKKVVDNQFCSVWCKEDYHFVMPGIKEVNSGRYFSLQASIEGKKMCYTSPIDENDEFEYRAEEQRKAVIDAYNTWIYYKAIVEGDWKAGYPKQQEVSIYNRTDGTPYPCGCDYDENWNLIPGSCTSTCQLCQWSSAGNCTGTIGYWDLNTSYKQYDYDGNQKNISNNLPQFGKVNKINGNSTAPGCSNDTCDPNNINAEDDFKNQNYPGKLADAAGALDSAIKAYAKLVNDYNACFGENTYEYDNSTLDDNPTNGWKMDYKFEPKIKFWYQESYMNNVKKDELDTVGSLSISKITETLYEKDDKKIPTGDTTDNFKELSSIITSDFTCYHSGNEFECDNRPIKVGTVKYVKQEMESKGEFITPTQFYTIYPTGTIVVGDPKDNIDIEENVDNSDELTNMLPVGLGTKQGVYNYVLKAEDLGEYYDSKELGRIWKDSSSTLPIVLEEAESGDGCSTSGSLASDADIKDNELHDGVYVCSYKVNCPDCPVECDPTCKNPSCPDNNCPVECVNCIYTNNSPNINYRPIAPGDVNPNDKELGVNWRWDENGISTGLELKAFATLSEIEEAGETIYDIDYEDTTQTVDTTNSIKIKLDTNMINKVKAYNDKYDGTDGYANNSLKCYDHKNSNDGQTYKNIYCYSTFIDELIYDSSTADNVLIDGNRIIGSNASSSDTLRKAQTQASGYWTTWSEVTPSWNISTSNGFAYYQQNYLDIGIGPSWK